MPKAGNFYGWGFWGKQLKMGKVLQKMKQNTKEKEIIL